MPRGISFAAVLTVAGLMLPAANAGASEFVAVQLGSSTGARLLVRRGRDVRALKVRRATSRAHRLRIELRTTKGRVTLTRRVAACR